MESHYAKWEASCPVVDGQQNKLNRIFGEHLPHSALLEHFVPCLLLMCYGFQFGVFMVCLCVYVFIVLFLSVCCFILACLLASVF